GRAAPVALVGAIDTVVDALSGNAGDVFVRSRRGTNHPAAAAVENVVLEVGAVIAATGFSVSPAVVAAGTAIRVRLEIAADPLARGNRTAGVAATCPGQSAGVAVAGLAGRQTLILLFLVCAFAKRLAGIDLARPRGFEAQRAEDGASEDSAQPSQRLAAGD